MTEGIGHPKMIDWLIGWLISKYLLLCSTEKKESQKVWFGTTWEWVNNDTIFSFGWTVV